MFLNVHTIVQSNDRTDKFSKVTCFEKFVTTVTELLHQLVVEGYVKAEHHGMMLRDMGLHQGCWSLSVIPKVLSLLARVLICRLQVMGDQEDPLSLSIWKGSVLTEYYVLIRLYICVYVYTLHFQWYIDIMGDKNSSRVFNCSLCTSTHIDF